MTTTINPERLSMLRLQRGLAIRRLALESGVGVAVINRLDSEGSIA